MLAYQAHSGCQDACTARQVPVRSVVRQEGRDLVGCIVHGDMDDGEPLANLNSPLEQLLDLHASCEKICRGAAGRCSSACHGIPASE